jgi:hypothetical protein
MPKRKIGASTSVTLPLFIINSTTGAGLSGLSGLTSASSGLVCKYRRQGQSSWTTVSLSAATLGTWSSGGFIADTGGVAGTYGLGLPNAAVASGAQWVIVQLSGAADMAPVCIEMELDAVNYQDANLGLSRLDATVSSRLATSGYTTPPTASSNASAVRTELATELGRLDASVSSRSTYAGGDTSGVTTLLGRLSSTRAGLLDNLDAAISTRLALVNYNAPDNTTISTLATRLTASRALLLDNLENLDMAISDVPTASEISDELVGMTVTSIEI